MKTPCANRNEAKKCERPALPLHIFCNECRVALGGYLRYTFKCEPVKARKATI